MRGMSISGLSGGCGIRTSTLSAMLTAWSPIRSRSALIFIAEVMSRRSTASGVCVASRRRQRLSMSIWRSLTSLSVAMIALRVLLAAVDERVDRAVHALLHQPPHGEELVPQRLQLGFEVVPFHSLSSPAARSVAESHPKRPVM